VISYVVNLVEAMKATNSDGTPSGAADHENERHGRFSDISIPIHELMSAEA
jgi:hypothetical protein